MPTATIPAAVTAPGWSAAQVIATLHSPVFQPAIVIKNGQPLIGWWARDSVISSSARLTINRGSAASPTLTGVIGQQPDSLTLFSSVYGVLAIWRDQNTASIDPADRRLYGALLDSDLKLTRTPTVISDRATTAYSAVQLSTGAIIIAWTGHADPVADALWLSVVDPGGATAPALPVAMNVAHPALTVNAADDVIAAWLIPQPGATWTMQATIIQLNRPATPPISFQIGVPVTLGFLHPAGIDHDRLLDSFALAADGTTCYVAWSTATLSGTASANLSALNFPCAGIADSGTRPAPIPTVIDVAAGGEWPMPLSSTLKLVSGAPLPIGLTLTDLKPGLNSGDSAAVAWLAAGKTAHIDRLSAPVASTTIGRVALVADPDTGRLSAVWSSIDPDGRLLLNFAQQL